MGTELSELLLYCIRIGCQNIIEVNEALSLTHGRFRL